MRTAYTSFEFLKYFDTLQGASGFNECATITQGNGIDASKETFEENGMSLQIFVDCCQLGDRIIFDSEFFELQNSTVVKHPVVFDVADTNKSRMEIQFSSAGTVFDVQ